MTRLLVAAALLSLLWATPAGAGEASLGEWETTAGEACILDAHNGESVWPGNVLLVDNGGQLLEVPAVEDEADIDTVVEFVAAGGTVTATVVYAEWSSLEATVECRPAPTTTTEQVTTTTEATTTTEQVTTTTEATTSSTTEQVTTTTSSSTTVPSTTTTTPDPCAVEGACLPDTGADTGLVVAGGLLLMVLGSIALVSRELLSAP